jgi:hypothetical protein
MAIKPSFHRPEGPAQTGRSAQNKVKSGIFIALLDIDLADFLYAARSQTVSRPEQMAG